MAHILLIVEGQTEEQFYKRLVQNEFRNEDGTFRHYFQVVVMPSKKNIYSRSHKGGAIGYEVCTDNIKRFLRQASHCDLTLLVLDYYGLHDSFKSHLSNEHQTLEQKILVIQSRLEAEIGVPRFKFRLQVHEFEAYLFSDPEKVTSHFQEAAKLATLREILANFNGDPERINDDPATAPSKRLKIVFPNFGKTTDGIAIAEKTGISTIRQHCQWFDKLCNLFDALD
jgi:Domain of unknown function (DUF4276)